LRADKEGAERKKQKKQSCARCDIQQLEGETHDKSERVTSVSRVTKHVPARAYKERTESKSRRNASLLLEKERVFCGGGIDGERMENGLKYRPVSARNSMVNDI